eukprot:366367-Chlamydomonas_euryale.AAC.20
MELNCGYPRLAARNNHNCRKLLEVVQDCDRAASDLMQSNIPLPRDAKKHLDSLVQTIGQAGKTMRAYAGRDANFALRMLLSTSESSKFEELDGAIRRSVQVRAGWKGGGRHGLLPSECMRRVTRPATQTVCGVL